MTNSGVDEQDPLRCTFEDSERNNLLAGIRMSTSDKIKLFEEMLDFAWKTGAINRLGVATGWKKQTARALSMSGLRTRFYLFLDVDGVLHRMVSTPGGRHRLPDDEQFLSRLPLLEKTIRPHLQELQIIVSSTWRLHPPSLQGLLDCMSEDVRGRVAGTTPERHGDADENRPNEIVWWLNKHGQPGVKAIVLDDHPQPPAWLCFQRFGTWIEVDSARALDERVAARLAQLLAGA